MSIQGTPSTEAVERTVARSEITALLQRYANMAVEKADFAGMARLFTSDGKFILLDGTAVPVTEIERIVAGNEATWIRHHLTTINIEFTGDGEATADSYYIAFTDLAQPDHWGRWRDTLRREDDGQWKLTSKQPVVEGYHPEGWVATVLFPAMQAQA
ncbi:nuclear transport factor 2 family protein [Sphaerimonospora sp. CA-214678]|uniref:nuclear transport factor 2 family protein n=1 Tax=Sphaerimonospora sp. CA-214678 TaxID=3240029 RepID=UPI003D8C06F1